MTLQTAPRHDFYSDTKTKPSEAMLRSVLGRSYGDEQKNECPVTAELNRRVADMLGMEAAVLLPSGTMCNEIAIRVHIRPGEEIICERSCHIVVSEGGGPAALSGAMIKALDGERGMLTPDQVGAAICRGSRYEPRSRLLSVEQTANFGGGAVWPLERIRAVRDIAKAAGMAVHMDGARLMNAVVRSGVAAKEHCAGFDSAWIDLTKGLGAPVGAVLAGSADFIDRAWMVKQQIGGAMRQSGVIAAMGLYALDHNVARLAEDHALAAWIGEQLGAMRKVARILPVETNIVIFDLTEDAPEAAEIVRLARAEDVGLGAFGKRRLRVVTHLDVDRAGAEALCAVLRHHLG